MVTAADLARAAQHLAVLRATTGAVVTDTSALARSLDAWTGSTGWWTGPQGDDLRTALDALATRAGTAGPAWSAADAAVRRLHATADALAAELAALERQRTASQGTLARLWRSARAAVEDTFGVDAGIAEEEAALARLEQSIAEVGERWMAACRASGPALDSALASVEGATRDQPHRIRLGAVVLPTGVALDMVVGLLAGEPPRHTDPDAVDRWWRSLSTDERRAWLDAAPHVVGNLDGIPFPTRVAANHLAIQALVDSLPPGDPQRERLTQFLLADGTVDPTRQIVVFDPRDDGRVAELFGDLATASHVAVVVPGMGSTMANFSEGVRGDAEALYAATPGAAVIAWTGYDAPAGIETGRVWEVASSQQAVAGGAALVPFLATVHGQRSPAAAVTLIGHSYGSHTVGQALLQGGQVDRAVFIGSPGVGVDHVSDFPDGAVQEVFAGEVKGDPVATLERFGESPTDARFGAYAYDAGPADSLSPIARHSEYFDEGTALDNLSTIVSGGTPTPDQPRLIERGVAFVEDTRESVHDRIDDLQDRVHVPVVGPALDGIVDGVQVVERGAAQAVEVVAETTGHYVTDAGEWVWDRGGDLVDSLGDRFDRWTSWR